MSFKKKTIHDIELKGKTVLLHGELDAPLSSDGKEVTSDFRVEGSIPTIKALLEKDCKVIIISKLGRPDGKPNPKMSLFPVAKRLQELLGTDIEFVADCIGDRVKKAASKLQPGQVLMLENLRFHPEEEANDQKFAQAIVTDTGADVFVQDCFALAHRKEAGTDAITRCLPSVAGLHLETEVRTITEAMHEPKRPLVAIIGGAKLADKIEILDRFVDIADFVAVGGAMANTFLVAQGHKVGTSLYDKDGLKLAKEIIDKAEAKAKKQPFVLALPHDVVVASKIDKTAPTRIVDFEGHVMSQIQHYPKQPPVASGRVEEHEMILDVGPFFASFVAGAVQLSSTVVWNGAVGVTETASLHDPVGPTAHGTETIMEAIIGDFGNKPFSIVGGGDTVGYVESRDMVKSFSHVSAGGGASMELMSGHKLPGVEALEDK